MGHKFEINKFKKNILIMFSFILLVIGCSESEEINKVSMEKFTDNGNIYSIENFLDSGFKINKEYDVSKLPESKGVYYGFWKNNAAKAIDIEVRIYSSHQLAIDSGIPYVDEVIGEEAILKKSESSWNEGIQDRRTRSDGSYAGSSANTVRAKYIDYIVFGNSIILCTGLDLNYARQNCSDLANSLKNNP